MALYTKKLIVGTFEEMLNEQPFDKITVAALVRRAGVSPNTFYYHYQDIYALLDTWFQEKVADFLTEDALQDWKSSTKTMLYRCRKHPKIIYHLFDCLSRDRMERYIFSMTDDVFIRLVRQMAEGQARSETDLRSIAAFCRYAYIGFVLQFFWNRMEDDIDESVDHLAALFDSFLKVSLSPEK